jgi:hypothetical protein
MATGGAVGAATGVGIAAFPGPGARSDLVVPAAIAGAVLGALVAIVPSAIAGVFVAWRPLAWAPPTPERDLTLVIGWVVGILNGGVLLLWLTSGAGLEPVPALLLANAAGGLVLWRAHRSIAQALSAA